MGQAYDVVRAKLAIASLVSVRSPFPYLVIQPHASDTSFDNHSTTLPTGGLARGNKVPSTVDLGVNEIAAPERVLRFGSVCFDNRAFFRVDCHLVAKRLTRISPTTQKAKRRSVGGGYESVFILTEDGNTTLAFGAC